MARYRRRRRKRRRRRNNGMKKRDKDMLKGGALATALLIFQPQWYARLVSMIRGGQ